MTDIVQNDFDPVAEADVKFKTSTKTGQTLSSGVNTVSVGVSSEDLGDAVASVQIESENSAADAELTNVVDNDDGSFDVTINNTTGGEITVDVKVTCLYVSN